VEREVTMNVPVEEYVYRDEKSAAQCMSQKLTQFKEESVKIGSGEVDKSLVMT